MKSEGGSVEVSNVAPALQCFGYDGQHHRWVNSRFSQQIYNPRGTMFGHT
jgi:hypothetical protein